MIAHKFGKKQLHRSQTQTERDSHQAECKTCMHMANKYQGSFLGSACMAIRLRVVLPDWRRLNRSRVRQVQQLNSPMLLKSVEDRGRLSEPASVRGIRLERGVSGMAAAARVALQEEEVHRASSMPKVQVMQGPPPLSYHPKHAMAGGIKEVVVGLNTDCRQQQGASVGETSSRLVIFTAGPADVTIEQ